MIHQRLRQTERQTDGRTTDGQTDDMQLQYRALQYTEYSASRGKNEVALWISVRMII